MAQDHYRTLGVAPSASAADLRAAYLKLARANHPDTIDGQASADAQKRMQQINEAWNVLGVAHKRREYDAANPISRSQGKGSQGQGSQGQGSQGQARQATPGSSGRRRGHAHFTPFDDDPIDRADVDLDPTPISGSKGLPRWMAFLPVCLVVVGVVTLGFATMVGANELFQLGIVALVLGFVCFLMLPLIVMSRAAKDPDL